MTALRSVLSLGAIPVALGILAAAVGCNTGGGGGEVQTATQVDSRMHSQATVVANAAAMPACTAQTHNNLMYLSDSGTYQSCFVDEKGKYSYGDVDIRPKTATGKQVALQLSGTSELPYCNYFNRGLIAFVKPTKTIYACEEWAPNYWRFGWKDITVKGEVGAKGAIGDKGAKGDKGDTGDTGATGAKGTAGDTGAQGAKGATGDQGLAGDKGATGDTGAQGAKGATGDTGAQGAKGETGDKGLAGDQGEKGETGDAGTGCSRTYDTSKLLYTITCGDTQATYKRLGGFYWFDVGSKHVCTVDGVGYFFCWGSNDHGQLGVQNISQANTPMKVVGEYPERVRLSIEGNSSCIVDVATGKVYCWGRNYDDGIGAGPADNDIVQPRFFTKLENIWELDHAEDSGGCMRFADKTVSCWGYLSRPNEPRTPQGTQGDPSTSPIRQIPGLTEINDIVVSKHGVACALDKSQVVRCWGKNGPDKIIEDSNRDVIATPTIRQGVPPLVSLKMADRSICGLTVSGDVWCWGTSTHNSLGVQTKSPVGMSPFKVALPGPVYRLFGGGHNYCVRMRENTDIYCWGDNRFRKLGPGVANGAEVYGPQKFETSITFEFIAMGENTICGRSYHFRGYCWGSNSHGQFGNGTFGGESAKPVPVNIDDFTTTR